MTNNQIIRNEAARLDPATLHAIATAHHTPDEIAAIAAACKTTDENGNEQPATVADVEIMLAADELHTFDHWKKEGKSVKKGEKHLVCCYLWKYTTKPSKEQREKAAAEGKEAAPDPHYYPTKSHLFSCLQVESSKPAPAGRFGSTAAIIEYNKKLAAERKAAKAAKEAAEKAKAEAPAPVIIEEHHELPELVHVDPDAVAMNFFRLVAVMFQNFVRVDFIKRLFVQRFFNVFRSQRHALRPPACCLSPPRRAIISRKGGVINMWVYHSSIGPLYIVPTGDGLFGFLYNGIIWEACPTPQIEADNVYCRATGCPDASNLEELPHDLSEWTYISK